MRKNPFFQGTSSVYRISDHSGLYVCPGGILYPHEHVGRIHDCLLVQCRADLSRDGQVHRVGHGLVGQVVLAGQRQAQIGRGDDAVVMLDDDLVGVGPGTVPLHAALGIVVTHGDGELQLVGDVHNAADGGTLGVDLAVEEGSGDNVGGLEVLR